MENGSLARELERLERLLTSAPRPEPSVALRRRVLGSMGSQLRRQRRVSRWRFAMALAAMLLLSLGPLLAAAHAANLVLQRRESLPSLHEVARRIQQLSPDISSEESVRRAMLIRIAAEAGCQAKLSDSYGRVLGYQSPGEML